MATGVETAGLVLATVPLVFSFIDQYRKGLQPLKCWIKYFGWLDDLKDDLNIDVDKFRLIFEFLLQPLVSLDQLERLLNDPHDPLWKSNPVQDGVKEHLQYSYESFTCALRRFYCAFSELHDRLYHDLNNEVSLQTHS